MLEELLNGLGSLMTVEMLLIVFAGALAGTLVGVLPGLGSVAGAAIVLPFSYALPPAAGMILITSIYVGAMYGGSTTATLLRLPGETSSVPMLLDGYTRTEKGRAGSSLAIMAVGSFIAGTIAVVLVMLFAPVLSDVAIAFGPAEYFALTAGGLLVMARMSGGSLASGLFPVVLGVMLGTVGLETITSSNRFTFGIQEMSLGVDIVPLAIGLFGIAQILIGIQNKDQIPRPVSVKLRHLLPTKTEWKRSVPSWGRGSVVGFFFGLLPGPSATLSSFAAYRLEKSVSKHRKEMGQGAVEGVAAPEAANNAAAVSGLVPALSLGLPFSATYALMLAAMIVQGVQPGPTFISEQPDLFWALISSIYVSAVILLILNLPLISVWVSVLRIPQHFLYPGMVAIAVVGTYSGRGSMIDVYVLLPACIVGYILHKLDFALPGFILGLVLGPLVEENFRVGMFTSKGEVSYFFSTPISAAIWCGIALVILIPPIMSLRRRHQAAETGKLTV